MDKEAGKIFVGGLSWQTNEESLRWHFEQYGPVLNVEVMRDRVTGDPRGFAFVTFTDAETVDIIMETQHEINHKIVDVKRAQARGAAPPSIHQKNEGTISHLPAQQPTLGDTPEDKQNKVFVGGIPPFIDDDGLKQLFEQFGAVEDAVIMMDQNTGRSRCFGFVTFQDGTDGAHKAVAAQPLDVQGRKVEVKLATPRGEQPVRTQKVMGPSDRVGLRAGISSSSGGEFAGLAVAYGRNGWKAGYGSKAFGKAGWNVQEWDDGGAAPERSGFSFAMLQATPTENPPRKRAKH